jgi:hypothetical protein
MSVDTAAINADKTEKYYIPGYGCAAFYGDDINGGAYLDYRWRTVWL